MSKSPVSILLFVSLSVILFTFALLQPNETQAHPMLGITPTPTKSSEPAPPPEPEPSSDSSEPAEIIDVALGCAITCPVSVPAVQVQLVHNGTGFIIEGSISGTDTTRFMVPFEGEWSITMIAPENRPLGVVYTNSGAQVAECPFECAAPIVQEEAPGALPETGTPTSTAFFDLFVTFLIGLALLVGVMIIAFRRSIMNGGSQSPMDR